DLGVRRNRWWVSQDGADRVRPFDRVRRLQFLSDFLFLRRRRVAAMIEGFEVPLYRSLTEPVLLAGAPRAVAVVNGTIAAALGLGLQLWVAGLILWVLGHSLAVFAAK